MNNWLKQYSNASSQTKYFILNWVVYSLAMLITTVYCYGRLDFVRSYQADTAIEAKKQQNKAINEPLEVHQTKMST